MAVYSINSSPKIQAGIRKIGIPCPKRLPIQTCLLILCTIMFMTVCIRILQYPGTCLDMSRQYKTLHDDPPITRIVYKEPDPIQDPRYVTKCPCDCGRTHTTPGMTTRPITRSRAPPMSKKTRIVTKSRVTPKPTTRRTTTAKKSTPIPTGWRVIYNRVPKSGSRGVLETTALLSRQLGYKYVNSRIYAPNYLFNDTEEDFIHTFMQYGSPMFYNRLLHFVDFTRYGYQQPIYINLIRDPYERLVSEFYYTKRYVNKASPRYKQSFDDCASKQRGDCVDPYYTFRAVPFFCGQVYTCRLPSSSALARAKQNIERYYLTVGLTEKMPEFFKVLENRLPLFYKGAHSVFKNTERVLKNKYKGASHPAPKPGSRAALLRHLRYDYDLYAWVLQRFNQQYQRLNLTLTKGRPVTRPPAKRTTPRKTTSHSSDRELHAEFMFRASIDKEKFAN